MPATSESSAPIPVRPVRSPRVLGPVLGRIVAAGYAAAVRLDSTSEALALWCEGKGFL